MYNQATSSAFVSSRIDTTVRANLLRLDRTHRGARTRGDDPQAATLGRSVRSNALHALDNPGTETADVPAPLEAVMHRWAAGEVVAPLLQGLVLRRERRKPELRDRTSEQCHPGLAVHVKVSVVP